LVGPISQGLIPLQSMWNHAWGILWGPPGTGKTYSIGQHVAQILGDATERILITSTTNKALDEAAFQLGKACASLPDPKSLAGRVLRVGKGVNLKRFQEAGSLDLVRGTEAELLHRVAALKEKRDAQRAPEIRAALLAEIKEILKRIKDIARHAFMAADVEVVLATAFRASTMLWYPEFRELLLFHYNVPYGDIFMGVAEPLRRRGYGSYLIQELKRTAYEMGKVPAARCNATNVASRASLQKAGMLPCARVLTGVIAS
jgi:GNAT superfamily N-acetyltransferase